MEWTKEDTKQLLAFKTDIDSDDIRVKENIKAMLLDNRFIMHVLNNTELEKAEAEPDEYYGVNILPYYLLAPTQSNVQNFICYEISYQDLDRYNDTVKILQIIFYILCEQKNLKDKDTGLARHDLLAALIQKQFNYSTDFGGKIKLVSDIASTVDTSYACRTLTFESRTDNNLTKTWNGSPRIVNRGVDTHR